MQHNKTQISSSYQETIKRHRNQILRKRVAYIYSILIITREAGIRKAICVEDDKMPDTVLQLSLIYLKY